MVVTATDVQNNFGKYLRMCSVEPVLITRNGVLQAVLSGSNHGLDTLLVGEEVIQYGTRCKKKRG